MRVRLLVMFVLLLVAVRPLVASEKRVPDPRRLPQWVGTWEVSPAINTALGYADANSREGAVFDQLLSFQLSLDETLGQSTNTPEYEGYRESYFPEIGHKVIATGRWETTFEHEDQFLTGCFITEREGSTFLWIPVPYAVVFGGKISFLQGSDPEHDVLVIDFNSFNPVRTPAERTADTVAFKRSAKESGAK